MCGILGYATATPGTHSGWVRSAINLLRHRGPDDQGIWFAPDESAGFGHSRLAVVDLSPAGHQPMVDPAGRYVLAFNGEIYNHIELRRQLTQLGYHFAGRSDTEVLLTAFRAWGKDCLERLSGMFALAIFDNEERTLFLARDRIGEKPLFYYYDDQSRSLVFASELKAIIAHPEIDTRIDFRAMDCLLGMGFVPGQSCILKKCHKIEPGSWLEFSISHGTVLRRDRFWSAGEIRCRGVRKISLEQSLAELEERLEAAVASQMHADVPIGILLSGGLDSSLIASMAARASSAVRTFTVSFPGHGGIDEAEHAAIVARHLGTDHMVLEAKSVSPELIQALAIQYDEPIADSSMIPTSLVSRLVREHCTVALGGDGGDELFGGYPHYPRMLRLMKLAGSLPTFIRKAGARVARQVPLGSRGANWLGALDTNFAADVPNVTTLFGPRMRRELIPGCAGLGSHSEVVRSSRIPADEADLVDRAMRFDLENYLPEDILVKVDRASMLHSLEVRAPFLDREVVEFALQLPRELKVTTTERKVLLKLLARKLLPGALDVERKQGFSIPITSWLRSGSLRELCWETLLDGGSMFDQRTIRRLLASQDRGYRNGERIFLLTLIELWRRAYRLSV